MWGWGAKCFFVCVCAEETERVKNCLGVCSLKVTCPDGKCSKILVSSPVKSFNPLPSLATDGSSQFNCGKLVFGNKTRPLPSVAHKRGHVTKKHDLIYQT